MMFSINIMKKCYQWINLAGQRNDDTEDFSDADQ